VGEDHPAAGARTSYPGRGPQPIGDDPLRQIRRAPALNRQSENYAWEDIELDVSTLAHWASLAPLIELIRRHVLAAERIHADDTAVTCWPRKTGLSAGSGPMVRNDRPFAVPDPPGTLFFYSRNRRGEHPSHHLAGYAGILEAPARRPGRIAADAQASQKARLRAEVAGNRQATLLRRGAPTPMPHRPA
jgi:hypothetical protein